MFIYVLSLEGNKFYVGRTDLNVDDRFEQHKNGNGSMWTKLYAVVKIVECFETYDSFDEDKYVFKYMGRYGIDNVRGGSFSTINISDGDKRALIKIIRNAFDCCLRCGYDNHFTENCFACKDIDGNILLDRYYDVREHRAELEKN